MADSINPNPDTKRKKREGILIVIILIAVAGLTFIETRITHFGNDFPLSSTILMFILINTTLLLLLALLLLVFRNLAKLYYEKKNKILGTKLKTRLIAAFIVLALLPTTVLFFFSIQFISTSIAFWFNAPVEQTLDSSMRVGRKLYEYIETENEFSAKRAVFQIDSRKLLDKENETKLTRYAEVIQRAFNHHAVEIYTPDARRVSLSLSNRLEVLHFGLLTSNELTDIPEDHLSHTISQDIQEGELLRTIATIPFACDPKKAEAFIVISTLLSPDLSWNLQSIQKGTEEYHQLKLAKKPALTFYYTALSVVALLVIFCAVWFGFQLAKTITIPIMKFAEGTKRVADGDLDYRIDFESDDEIGTLVKSFNSMTTELASGREQIALSEERLRNQNAELEKSRQYIEIVLKNISAGVISIDNAGTIITINTAAESLLDIKSHDILHKNYKDVLKNEYLKLTDNIAEQVTQGQESIEIPLSVTISGTPKHFSLNFTLLKDDSDQNLGAVLVFDDVTELEKAQRVAAWREVARRIAHEVKNPLTPIKLSAQRLKRKYAHQINDDIFTNCTDTIVEHVDLIRNLVNEFSTFAKFPDANIAQCRIENIILETIALYREGLEKMDIRSNFAPNIPVLKLDHQHMKQAFINLIDNAVYAVDKKGEILIDVSYDEILKIVRIEIADNGKGISDKEKTRLFEPYFSTKKSGMGLGLAIVNSIISDHNGVIRVQDNKPRGAKFIIELPA
ncbi:MAG: PAS domain-containing sensor histidine kinase [Desulfobacula sp. RIFOXYB2_FULL_45_6]|nr:MAG: PAS domain-containing sensor histidine kinase [Desulfobacula sp. RIFOXYB2_FULL_45_6]